MLGFHDEAVYGAGVLFDRRAIIADEAAKMEAYDIRPRAPLLKTANFSGGNQQKIVLAREIERNPAVILVGQPTRGVDIGAIEFIHKRIVAMRDAGKAVLLVSVELDEIFALVRPHPRALRRPHHRRAAARGDQRPGPRPADGGRQPSARHELARLSPLPAWADVALIPLLNVGAAFFISGLVVLAIGENPIEAVQAADLRRARRSRRHRLHALLRHELHLHRPRGRDLLSRRPLQHRRRGAGLCRRPGRRARRALSRLSARLHAW